MNNLVQAIDQLSIEGVRPKPQGLTASLSRAGSGTRPSTGTTISGEVPQVTCGWMSAALMRTT